MEIETIHIGNEKIILPKFKHIEVRGEAEAYGIAYQIAKKLKLSKIHEPMALWDHGVRLSPVKYLEQLVREKRKFCNRLVGLKEHEIFMRERGVKSYAVGYPFNYVQSLEGTRKIEGSLLIMPPHSLPYTEESWDEFDYVKKVKQLQKKFSSVVACISPFCIEKGHWVKAFEEAEIPVLEGASRNDAYALVRMKTILSSFEYMTTPTMGSHVVYAASVGCKVSMWGDFIGLKKSSYKNDPFYKIHPHILDVAVKESTKRAVKKRLPWMFCEPEDAVNSQEWGKNMLGVENLVGFERLADLFQWNMKGRLLRGIRKLKKAVKK